MTHADANLSPEALVRAYAHGYFPMADSRFGRVRWYTAEARAILPLESFHVPRRLRRTIKQRPFEITFDGAFEDVIRACAEPRAVAGGETWISEAIIDAYIRLHDLGLAHSVEAWRIEASGHRGVEAASHKGTPTPLKGRGDPVPQAASRTLVGGIYGVTLGAAFFGESMFSRPNLGGTDASKICLVHLVEHLRSQGYVLFDAQFWTPHLTQFGCETISRPGYLKRLRAALTGEHVKFGP